MKFYNETLTAKAKEDLLASHTKLEHRADQAIKQFGKDDALEVEQQENAVGFDVAKDDSFFVLGEGNLSILNVGSKFWPIFLTFPHCRGVFAAYYKPTLQDAFALPIGSFGVKIEVTNDLDVFDRFRMDSFDYGRLLENIMTPIQGDVLPATELKHSIAGEIHVISKSGFGGVTFFLQNNDGRKLVVASGMGPTLPKSLNKQISGGLYLPT